MREGTPGLCILRKHSFGPTGIFTVTDISSLSFKIKNESQTQEWFVR